MLICSYAHADIYLTNSLPGGKPHTFCREEKQQEKVKRTKWWSRDKVFGGRKYKRKEWETDQEGGAVEKRIIWAKQKRRKRGRRRSLFKQFSCIWAHWAATHALLIPASTGLLLSLSCLAAHLSLWAKALSHPSGRCTPHISQSLTSVPYREKMYCVWKHVHAIILAWHIKKTLSSSKSCKHSKALMF